MKKALKRCLLGVLSMVICFSCNAYAASETKTIEVTYNDIQVYKDNVLCELNDSNGMAIEPFIYNGTIYMPVGETAALAGMDATWDGSAKILYLWDEIVSTETYLMDVCPPYSTGESCHLYFSSGAEYFSMAGERYTNGLTLGWSDATYALFNLNGKYESMEMVIAPVDGSEDPRDVAFIVDGKNIAEYVVNAGDYPQKISIPLNYGLQLKIAAIEGAGSSDTGLGSITVK